MSGTSGIRIVDMPDLGALTSSASVVGELAGSGRFQINALRDYVILNNKGTHGFYTDQSPFGVVTYGADRLFVGAATTWSGHTGDTDTTWMAAAFPGFGVYGTSTFAAIDNFSMSAVSAATRSTDSRPVAQQVVIGGTFLASNQATTQDVPTWALYTDARRMPSAGSTIAIESDIANLATLVPNNPYNYQPVGSASNLWLASGSGLTSGLHDANEAIAILANGAKFAQGILFASTALTGTDGLTGLGVAVQMANRQALAWSNNAGNEVGQIYSTITTAANSQVLSFTDGGLAVNGATGVAGVLMQCQASCNSAVVLQGGAGTVPPAVTTFANSGSGAISLYLAPQNGGAVITNGSIQPAPDNSLSCGVSTNRWSAVWAGNGAIQTSDPALKTDIADLPTALPLVAAITPKVFRWKDGGRDRLVTQTTMDVPVRRTVTRIVQDHEVQPDGRVHLVQRTIETEEDEIDLVPVTLSDGTPVMDRVPLPTQAGRPRRYEDRPRMHPVPRTQKATRETTSFVPRPGKRLHWGFMAPEVKAAFDAIGMDFGGYVLAEDGTHNLRPDQMIPVLWQAVRELAADFAAYKAAHP
jgi:hypothetical protein